jgi:hypothetical protein
MTANLRVLALAGLLVVSCTSALAQEVRVLIVGDSWAEEMWEDGSHALVFADNDLGHILAYGETTTESGSTAAEWKQAGYLQRVVDALAQYPDIDTIQLTVGGNDFLNTWNTDFTDKELDALKLAILTDLILITDYILGLDPDIEIILSFYDYPNFVDTLGGWIGLLFCNPLWNDLGQPTPQEINEVALVFEALYIDLADNNPRIHHASHFGLMQYSYGFPDDGIPPGTLLPPGDETLPSPLESMRNRLGLGRDCFHLEPAGYDLLVQNLVDHFYADRFADPSVAEVQLDNLEQVYDGTPKLVSVATDPSGLNVEVTYDGNEQPPSNAGSYTVIATVIEDDWVGSTEGTLIVAQAEQTIDFPPLPNLTPDSGPIELEGDSESGLPVSFAVLSGPASIDGNTLLLDGEAGTVVIEASQPGDNNWLPAEPVVQSFEVIETADPIFHSRFEMADER